MSQFHQLKIVGLIALFMNSASLAEEPVAIYSQVDIDIRNISIQELANMGVTVDHHGDVVNNSLRLELSQYEIQILKNNKVNFRTLIEDYAKHIETRNILEASMRKKSEREQGVPENFKKGTMGGYLTNAETQKELDEMRRLFPNLASAKIEIGKTLENRPIYALKLSNKPNEDLNRPRVLFEGMIHCREGMAMMNIYYLAWHLLENYAKDPEIKRMFDELEIFILPVLNPDGFEYNRSTNPNGGGMWRKNRSTNSGGTRGVDLNRNFSVLWNNSSGNSTDPGTDTYRGPTSFSEPETKAYRDFHLAKKFTISISWHSAAKLLLHPYGEGSKPTNLADYQRIATAMTRSNGWRFGPVPMIGYNATGVTMDWVHEVGKSIAFGGEMGGTGFYPPENQINTLAQESLNMNLELIKYALPVVTAIKFRNKKINESFYGETSLADGKMNFNYNLLDDVNSWYLTVLDINGKQIHKEKLSATNNSVSITKNKLSRLFMIQVKSCGAKGCESVYTQKVAAGAF